MINIEYKICTKCNINKEVNLFTKNCTNCKECMCLRSKLYRKNNPEKVKTYMQKWKKENKERERIYRNNWYSNKIENDSFFKLKSNIRTLIRISLKSKNIVKNSKTFEILGCDYIFFKDYIQSQFTKEMNWNNIHLDHIKPLSSAKSKKEVLDLNHYTNFQPLLAIDNLKKGVSIIEKQLKLL